MANKTVENVEVETPNTNKPIFRLGNEEGAQIILVSPEKALAEMSEDFPVSAIESMLKDGEIIPTTKAYFSTDTVKLEELQNPNMKKEDTPQATEPVETAQEIPATDTPENVGGDENAKDAEVISETPAAPSESTALAKTDDAVQGEIVAAEPEGALNDTEKAELAEAESKIEGALEGFFNAGLTIGEQLSRINQKKLWRESANSFSEYITSRFDITREYGYQLQTAAAVYEEVVLGLPEAERTVANVTSMRVLDKKMKELAKEVDGLDPHAAKNLIRMIAAYGWSSLVAIAPRSASGKPQLSGQLITKFFDNVAVNVKTGTVELNGEQIPFKEAAAKGLIGAAVAQQVTGEIAESIKANNEVISQDIEKKKAASNTPQVHKKITNEKIGEKMLEAIEHANKKEYKDIPKLSDYLKAGVTIKALPNGRVMFNDDTVFGFVEIKELPHLICLANKGVEVVYKDDEEKPVETPKVKGKPQVYTFPKGGKTVKKVDWKDAIIWIQKTEKHLADTKSHIETLLHKGDLIECNYAWVSTDKAKVDALKEREELGKPTTVKETADETKAPETTPEVPVPTTETPAAETTPKKKGGKKKAATE